GAAGCRHGRRGTVAAWAQRLQWEGAQRAPRILPELDFAGRDAAVAVAVAALVRHRLGELAPVERLEAAPLDLDQGPPAEPGGDQRGAGMQPDVVAMDRQQAEEGVQAGEQAEQGEGAIEDGDGAGVRARAPDAVADMVGLPGGQAPEADDSVHCAVQRVDREQAEQVPVESGNPDS